MPQSRLFSAISLFLGLATSTMVGAKAKADDVLIEAARKEGSVVWYTTLIEKTLVRPMVAAFEQKYPGIEVEPVVGLQGDLILRLLNEEKAGRPMADVFHGTPDAVVAQLKPVGLLEQYRPRAAEHYPDGYRDPEGYWTTESTLFLSATINTDLVRADERPKTYEDLLDPKWRGKMAWTTTIASGGPPGFIGTVLSFMGEDAGGKYLDALAKQDVRNVPSNQRAITDQVIAGEYPIGLMTFTHHAALSAEKGAPVTWLKLDPVIGILDVAVLIKNRPHPNAGKLFLEFILSSEGQAVFQQAGSIPADPNTPALRPELKPVEGKFPVKLMTPDILQKNFDRWVEIYNKKFR